MRILVTSTPGTGHLHPMVPLVQALGAAGHEVTWATASESCPHVERFGVRAVAAGMNGAKRNSLFAARATHLFGLAPRARRLVAMPLMFAELAAPAMYDDLVDIIDGVSPHLVIHDLAELVAGPLATNRGIPHVTVGFSGALADDLCTALLDAAAPIWQLEGLTPTLADFNGQLLLHPFPRTIDTPRADGPSAPMRPVSFDGAATTTQPLWVDGFASERHGVYISFGTEIAHNAPWRAIFDAVGELDIDAVATVGGQLDLSDIGTIPSNVRVERYVPQSFLIDRSSIVVSHAGAGTLIATASAGKPHLSIPIGADQWDNADLLARSGAAITLEQEQRDGASIRTAIADLLVDQNTRAAAATIKGALAAMPHPRDVVAVIEQLV